MSNDETTDCDSEGQSHTYSRDWLVDDVYYTSCFMLYVLLILTTIQLNNSTIN